MNAIEWIAVLIMFCAVYGNVATTYKMVVEVREKINTLVNLTREKTSEDEK